MRAMLEEELARKQREMQTATKNANIGLNRQFKDNNRANQNAIWQAENEDYSHQTNIRIVDPYQNPL